MIRPWDWQGEWRPGDIAEYPGGMFVMSNLAAGPSKPYPWHDTPFAEARAWLLKDMGLPDAC